VSRIDMVPHQFCAKYRGAWVPWAIGAGCQGFQATCLENMRTAKM
jgi:hypothetical protein